MNADQFELVLSAFRKVLTDPEVYWVCHASDPQTGTSKPWFTIDGTTYSITADEAEAIRSWLGVTA